MLSCNIYIVTYCKCIDKDLLSSSDHIGKKVEALRDAWITLNHTATCSKFYRKSCDHLIFLHISPLISASIISSKVWFPIYQLLLCRLEKCTPKHKQIVGNGSFSWKNSFWSNFFGSRRNVRQRKIWKKLRLSEDPLWNFEQLSGSLITSESPIPQNRYDSIEQFLEN